MDVKLDMTTNMAGPITTLMGSQSEGLREVASPPAKNTVGQQSLVMGPSTTNPVSSPLLNHLGGSSEGASSGRWVWMGLEGSQLHTLPPYYTELSAVVVVLVQITGCMPMCMQWLNMWEALLEFSPDLDLNQVCEALMDTEYWMGFHATLGMSSWMQRVYALQGQSHGLHQTRMWNGKTLVTNRLFLPLVLWGGYIYMIRSLKDQGGPFPTPAWCHWEPPTMYTLQLLRTWGFCINWWLLTMHGTSMGASWICPSMGSSSGNPHKVRMRSSMISGSLRWRNLGRHMGKSSWGRL